jgi:hypothetical protein
MARSILAAKVGHQNIVRCGCDGTTREARTSVVDAHIRRRLADANDNHEFTDAEIAQRSLWPNQCVSFASCDQYVCH